MYCFVFKLVVNYGDHFLWKYSLLLINYDVMLNDLHNLQLKKKQNNT